MTKNNNWRNIVVIVLCVTVLVLGIGFGFLSMQLEQYKNDKSSFDLNFVDVKLLSSIKGGNKEPSGNITIDKSGNILDMNFSLFNQYDEVSYEAKIRNDGSVSATIIGLLSSPDYKDSSVLKNLSPIIVSISELTGKILEPGEETSIKITVRYGTGEDVNKEIEVNGRLGIIAEARK